MKGIESYGKGGGGEGFQDNFMYLDKYLWVIKLNPIIEGKTTVAEEAAITSQEMATDLSTRKKEIYQQILKSFKISSSQ
jgi:hypothetical protein